MTPEELRAVVDNHRLWLAGTGGARADLQDANLRTADLQGANLRAADLRGADLRAADLQGANLRAADLRAADLRDANLRDANLRAADLRAADLRAANLQGANLRGANLPAPTMLLLADWGTVPPRLCRELMRYDAANAPDGTKRFNAWAKGGQCPYADLKIQRVAYFTQDRRHWRPGPAKSAYDLMVMCIRERCKSSDYHEALGTKEGE